MFSLEPPPGFAPGSELSGAIASWKREPEPSLRALTAIQIAALYDFQLAKTEAFKWLGRAISDGARSRESVRTARQIARHGIAVYADDLRSWLDRLEPGDQRAPLAIAMRQELQNFDGWERKRRSRFWLE